LLSHYKDNGFTYAEKGEEDTAREIMEEDKPRKTKRLILKKRVSEKKRLRADQCTELTASLLVMGKKWLYR
jgi:hypothetical protein